MALFGAMMFPTDYAIQPVELARAVEERGLDSLFFPEHTHIPPAGVRRGREAVNCRWSTCIRTTCSSRWARRRR